MNKDNIKAITPIDYWWNAGPSDEMPIYSIGGALYCASGWNGEAYLHSFPVTSRYDAIPGAREVELRPIYAYEALGVDPDTIREDADEYLNQIVDFEIR